METGKYYALSDYQMGIFIEVQTSPEGTGYNLPYLFTLPGDVAVEKLAAAIGKVFEAHPALLAQITKQNGAPVQYIPTDAKLSLQRVTVASKELEAYLERFVRPFKLFDTPLYRIEIIETENGRYLLYDFFHLIFDGASIVKFMAELDRVYQGESPEAEQVSVLEHAQIQVDTKGDESYKASEAYFDRELAGVEATDFAGDNPSGQNKSPHQRINLTVPKSETGDIRAAGFTPNQVFHAATALVLSRICRTEKVTHLTLHHGRTDEQMQRNLGYYVKTLPVCLEVKKNQTVKDFLNYVREKQKELYVHAAYPFLEVNRKYGLKPNVYYTYQGIVTEQYELAGKRLEIRPLQIDQHGVSVMVYDKEGLYNLRIVYDNTLYSERLAQALGEAVKCAVIDMMRNLQKSVSEIQLVSDLQPLLVLSEGEKTKYDHSQTFVDELLGQVARNPNRTSVVDEDSALTYAELDAAGNSLARTLCEAGVQPNTFVGVMMPRIKEYMVAVVAVWKAGGAYLPLDSEYPADRLQYMLTDSRTKVILTTRALFQSKQEEGSALQADTIIYLDEFTPQPDSPAINRSKPENLAYMIYTSGSTGKPKGVMIPHKALTCFTHAMCTLYGLTEQDKICCHSSFSFDASVEDLYPILTAGGEMHILSPELRFDMRALNDYIAAKGITGGGYTTQFGVEFITQFNPSVRYLTVGGEKMDRAPICSCKVFNTYGPTEFTVDATYFVVENGKQYRNIPIGRPLPNARAYIMDSCGNLLPHEFAGELCMSGVQTALGYWERPDLTQDRFLDDPFFPGEKLYRTGDLVRWNDEGQIEYLGRIDNQIKLRGFRIELGEIESALANYPGILSSCVDVRKIGTVEHLCAYYTSSHDIDEEALSKELAKSLTEYMVPTLYIRLETMPLTPNGKINRKALPAPEIKRTSEYVAPANDTERDICSVFSEVLKIDTVSATDDFFEIGGSSLMAIAALIKIENKGYTLAYGDLFKLKTPREIASFVSAETPAKAPATDYPIHDYDYSAIDKLLQSQRTDFGDSFTTQPLGNVLLTGATGYLGAHLLHDLIHHTESRIYCLLRSKKDISVDLRLKTMLMYYFGSTFEELFGKRIFTLEGDITDKDLAVKINVRIDTVINSAALVKHYEAGNDMERINYEAVVNLAEYALSAGAKLVHVSTYSTAGVSVNSSVEATRLFRETDLYIGQSHVLKYTWTKFLAERALLEMVAKQGLRAKIMRVGNLMGRASDGEFQVNFRSNAFVNSLQAYKALGAFPLERMVEKTEESPIDLVAHSIVLLSTTPDDVVVLQPYNCYEHDMGAIVKAMNDYGFPVQVVSAGQFAETFNAMMNNPEKSHLLSGILHSSGSKTVRYIGADNNRTTTILYRLGFYWSQSDGNYITSLLRMLNGMGFFDEN